MRECRRRPRVIRYNPHMKTVSYTALRGYSLAETAHLLRNPANAAHLRRGLAQVEARKTRRRKPLK